METSSRRKEIYTYVAPWDIFSVAWSRRVEPQHQFRLAVGSFVEQYNNSVQIRLHPALPVPHAVHPNTHIQVGEFDHPYPPTKIMWSPDKAGARDLLATTGDYLRLWQMSPDEPGGVKMEVLMNNGKNTEYCSPLTSFDWNEMDPGTIGTSSIDTTCTIWDVNTGMPRTQLIAHDKEVYDIAFARNKDVFASVGADGSVRMFDLRSLEHSTIIYETADLTPLLRLTWNKQDPNYLATILTDSFKTIIIDIRVPSLPVAELGGHQACVNAVAWAPHSSCHICTASDDAQALIWDLSAVPHPVGDPILAYTADESINNLQWSKRHPEWVCIAFGKSLQLLRV
ncbi:unnamed protein product [Chrysoparadoxa australica]